MVRNAARSSSLVRSSREEGELGLAAAIDTGVRSSCDASASELPLLLERRATRARSGR